MTNGIKKQDSIQVIREKTSAQILLSFQESQIDFLFTQLIHKPWGYACWQPFVDVVETPDAYIVTMDLPGIDTQTVRVHLAPSKITIEGCRQLADPLSPDARQCSSERPRGLFLRTIEIDTPVEADFVQSYEQGVLTITLEKQTISGGVP